MTGGARPLHMCGMSRGGDASSLVEILIAAGADVNSKDNYEYRIVRPMFDPHETTIFDLIPFPFLQYQC